MSHIVNLGDCLDPVTGLASLPDKSVDHVICDPPYSDVVHARLGLEGRNDGHSERVELDFGALSFEVAQQVAEHAARVARRWIVIFGDEFTTPWWRELLKKADAEHVREGVWVKRNPMPQMSGDRPASGFEKIEIAHGKRESGRLRWNGGGRPAVWFADGANPRGTGVTPLHPTAKPLALMEALVRDFTDPGETILDPFAGSGTTGVACKRLGRSFVGWERDEKYAEIARKRIATAREQMGLFAEGA